MLAYYEKNDCDYAVIDWMNHEFPPHLHRQAELAFCFSGSLTVDCGGQLEVLHPNSCMLAFPNTVHSYRQADNCRCVVCLFEPHLVPFFREAARFSPLRPYVHEKTGTKLAPCFHELLIESKRQLPNARIISGYLSIILAHLLEEMTLAPPTPIHDDIMSNLIEYLCANYTDDALSLENVAHRFAISPCYLSHLCSDKLGYSFRKYLNELRVTYAKNLLSQTNDTMMEIAMRVGFGSQRTFNRCFLKFEGISPGEYRKKGNLHDSRPSDELFPR